MTHCDLLVLKILVDVKRMSKMYSLTMLKSIIKV